MITDDEIAALCEVARSAGTDLSRNNTALLPDLLVSGYIAQDETVAFEQTRYKLTSAGQAVLDKRGVGANES